MKSKNPLLIYIFLAIGLVVLGAPISSVLAAEVLVDFEGGLPGGWFSFAGGGASVTADVLVVADTDPLARPGQVGDNTVLDASFDATTGFAGFGQDFAATTGPQDWISFTGVSFWMYGSGSGNTYQFEIFDNRSDPGSDTAERFDTLFSDDFSGWQQVTIPFTDFTRATDFQPPGAPDDGLTLTEMWGWAFPLDGNAGTLIIDDVGLEQFIVDDFESGLPEGSDSDGNPVGFFTFSDGSPVAISTTDTPPAPVPGSAAGNNVMQVDGDVVAFAGFIHAFENETLDAWVPQDWSSFAGISLWFYGQNTGTPLEIDILDNRNPGSTTDDAERFSISFADDFSGWQLFEFPFSDFARKEIGNGAPNDGFTLTQVHGWAFVTLSTPGAVSYYLDDAALYGVAEIPELAVTYTAGRFDIEEGTTGDIIVKLNRPMNSDDPAQVSVDYATEPAVALPEREYTPTSGTLTFVNGGPSELSFPLETFEDTKWEGDRRIALRLSNPVDVAAGFAMQSSAFIIENDPYDPYLLDDFERFPHLWESSANVTLSNPELEAGDPLARPGQDAYEGVLQVDGPIPVEIAIQGTICNNGNGVIPVILFSTNTFDAATVDHTTVTLGDAFETHINRKTGLPQRHQKDRNGDGLPDLTFHFRFVETGLDCYPDVVPFNGWTFDGQPFTAGGANATFSRDFALGSDWSNGEALTFWYYGSNSGEEVTVHLKDNRAPDPGPSGWNMVWAEEFNEAAGTPPNPDNWSYEIGDVTPDGKNGWGNDELQYYTDDPANAAADGQGNLVLTVREADGSLECYYGTCEYTSARLISWRKAEFAYGRIESRILVPQGAGIWPAFWSLGTDIDLVSWPQTGEIDFMEFVGRLPNEIFGTIHGPGYAGGASFGNVYDFGEPVYNDYHTFAVEWEPDLIRWYVDDILYHTATPADVAPNEWVFNDPVFLLLNVAMGGNFGGDIDPNIQLPQSMAVDYIRVYQGPDTAERFDGSFVDNFSGWQQVEVPFTSFARSTEQPAGAPDDGLSLNDVWGYGFTLPDGGLATGTSWLDFVRVKPLPPPSEVTVTTLANSGDGSLREALDIIAADGTITFDPSLAAGTINLTSGPLAAGVNVTIDASAAPGLSLNGGGADRVLIVDAGLTVTMTQLTVTNGYGFQLAGGILNNGNLTLDHVTVTGNTMTTDAGDFWQGGGGIYNGDGATLNLIDSTVSNNVSGWTGGGIYSFFNTTTNIIRSTISDNLALDVAGGMRLLGSGEIVNSTLSGNTSTTWHGGALFLTDGVLNVTNSTVTNNNAPPGTAGGLFVGTFGPSDATLTIQNSIVAANGDFGCFLAPFGSGAVAINSLGSNVFTDSSCFPIGSDQIVGSAELGPLADNGGPTLTHALLAGSPAIDAADDAVCPATDQRGVTRPQGSSCDAGAYEFEP